MDRDAFVSINRVGAGHPVLKQAEVDLTLYPRLSECGEGLQTEEHIFWNCKLYEDQRANMMVFCLKTAKGNTRTHLQSSYCWRDRRFVQGVTS
jgi:hypothetical protein